VNSRKLRIGFTFDARASYVIKPGEPEDKYDEFDHEDTIADIEKALGSSGHQVVRIGGVRDLLSKISAGEKWDIVFNIAEGVDTRNRESQAPMVLELFNIPYIGSDALTMGMSLDKAIAKAVVSAYNVTTAPSLRVSRESDLGQFRLRFPVIVKPNAEGTSKGIDNASVVRDMKALKARVKKVLEEYKQEAIVEEFIRGTEFTVAVIGNEEPVALPPVQIAICGNADLGDEIYSSERVKNDDIKYLCPAPIDKALDTRLKAMAVAAYKALGCRDFSRIDFRVDEQKKPYFLELNPLPHLGLTDVFPLVAEAAGLTYEELLVKIFDHGVVRNKI
jgi:D-alanine-D-alanine ligase